MKPMHKRLLIVVSMVIVTLIGYRMFGIADPVPQTEDSQLTPIPVEKNVPNESDTPWDQRLENVVQIYSKDANGKIISIGTGWFVKGQHGLIMTDEHVLDKTASSYQINLKDGRSYSTDMILWSSHKDDLAKIQIQTDDNLPHGFSVCTSEPQVADDVWLIGNPFDMPWSVHKGIIASPSRSNIPRFKALGFTSEYMEIDILMVPGMSGGPLLTKDDCVTGMAAFIYSMQIDDAGHTQILSFASKNDRILAAINTKP